MTTRDAIIRALDTTNGARLADALLENDELVIRLRVEDEELRDAALLRLMEAVNEARTVMAEDLRAFAAAYGVVPTPRRRRHDEVAS